MLRVTNLISRSEVSFRIDVFILKKLDYPPYQGRGDPEYGRMKLRQINRRLDNFVLDNRDFTVFKYINDAR